VGVIRLHLVQEVVEPGTQLEHALATGRALINSEDAREAAAALISRRAPIFHGR
jgi:hypothetical protein